MTAMILWDALDAMVSTPEFWPGIGLGGLWMWIVSKFGKEPHP